MAVGIQLLGHFQMLFHPALGLFVDLVGIFQHIHAEVHQIGSVGHGMGHVAVHHEKIFVTALLPDGFQQPLNVGEITGIGMDENGTVAIALGGVDVEIRHIVDMQLLFRIAHLIPLAEVALAGVYLAESFHGQEEHQLKGGHLAADGFAFQSSDKSFPIGHI